MKIKEILTRYNVIAVVGFSANPLRASNRIANYLQRENYKVFGVNPNIKEKVIDGISCYSSLKDIPEKIEIVDIFRRSEIVEDVVKEILELGYKPDVVWTQIGVINKNAKKLAESNGLNI